MKCKPEAMEKGLIIDFAKAFNKVSLLVYKLGCHGIVGEVDAWIKSFCADKKQSTAVNGTRSEFSPADSWHTRLYPWNQECFCPHPLFPITPVVQELILHKNCC